MRWYFRFYRTISCSPTTAITALHLTFACVEIVVFFFCFGRGRGLREKRKAFPKFEFIKYSTIERFTVKVRYSRSFRADQCDWAEISINPIIKCSAFFVFIFIRASRAPRVRTFLCDKSARRSSQRLLWKKAKKKKVRSEVDMRNESS